MENDTKPSVSFKDTLNLPKTDFPMRANHKELDAAMQARWEKEQLFTASFTHNEGKQKFILHDGPPYANGPIHLGHAYNKILKDLIAKSRRMAGKHVPVTPGWDCHGLPIEKAVSEKYPQASTLELIKHCRAYAAHWIDAQRAQFKALGVLMDWDHPYITMDYAYEAAILEAFGIVVDRGYIERKFKTVPWCATCKTSLAAAEIEYKDRRDPSLLVLFPLEKSNKLSHSVYALRATPDKNAALLVWTTTPWTLPLNRAVVIKPETTYVILDLDGTQVIMAQALVESVKKIVGKSDAQIVAQISARDLIGLSVHQPLTNKLVPIIGNPDVSLSDGTACVHTAPGCGPEDYELALINKLEIYSPLTPDGCYDETIEPADLVGTSIIDAQKIVIERLRAENKLVYAGTIEHPYPHCWRCHKGLMFRATKQWFISLSHEQLQNRAVKAIDTIVFTPAQSGANLRAAVESRLEWCISRQRPWGVPIPALICTACNSAYLTTELVDQVRQGVAQHGVEYWHEIDVKKMSHNVACASCGASTFVKEHDILDVWFESGVSHYAALKKNPALGYPADMYIEGRDQTRGWFQSSLLTSMALEKKPCMRAIITHGFTVDEQREKMSKSVGNVVAPQEIVDQYGTDVLRLWAANIDFIDDAVVSEVLLRNMQEVYRKMRNTSRFLLSNLSGFDIARDAVSPEQLTAVDQFALRSLYHLDRDVRAAYERADFTAVAHRLADYCANELSALYLDIIKDRLYVEEAAGHARRSAQTACWYILDSLTKLSAPILSFTAEQISDYYQTNKTCSIHLQDFATVVPVWQGGTVAQPGPLHVQTQVPHDAQDAYAVHVDEQWTQLLRVREAVLKAIEIQREQGIIKHSLESRILIFFDNTLLTNLRELFGRANSVGQNTDDFLRELFIVSQVEIRESAAGLGETALPGLHVLIERAQGTKCPRCWQYEVTTHEHGLCKRCAVVVAK